MTVDTFQRVVKTLGDSTRLRLLSLLERHELSVADLVKVLDLPQSTVSRHLAHIKEHGLLTERRDGAFCYSRFNPPCEGAWCSAPGRLHVTPCATTLRLPPMHRGSRSPAARSHPR